MESKPVIDFEASPDLLHTALTNRLLTTCTYHTTNEVIVSQVLDMMLEKTKMYGGNQPLPTLSEEACRVYYEGIARKVKRLPAIINRLRAEENDGEARSELIDTLVDICGYSILGLNDIGKHL